MGVLPKVSLQAHTFDCSEMKRVHSPADKWNRLQIPHVNNEDIDDGILTLSERKESRHDDDQDILKCYSGERDISLTHELLSQH